MRDVRSFDGTRLALDTWGAPDAPIVVLVQALLGSILATYGAVLGGRNGTEQDEVA